MSNLDNLIKSLEQYDLTNVKNVVKLVLESSDLFLVNNSLVGEELREELYACEMQKRGSVKLLNHIIALEAIQTNQFLQYLEQ
jgi:hypothetical protein